MESHAVLNWNICVLFLFIIEIVQLFCSTEIARKSMLMSSNSKSLRLRREYRRLIGCIGCTVVVGLHLVGADVDDDAAGVAIVAVAAVNIDQISGSLCPVALTAAAAGVLNKVRPITRNSSISSIRNQ